MSWVCLEQLARVAAHALAVRHNIARTKQAHGTSRHRPEVSRANLGVDLFQSAGVLSARRKVLFQFFVPNELILPRDERGELGQLFAAQLFYGFFYFRQAHAATVAAAAPEAIRSRREVASFARFQILTAAHVTPLVALQVTQLLWRIPKISGPLGLSRPFSAT